VIFSHARSSELEERAEREDRTVYELLNEKVEELSTEEPFPARLTEELHLLPYFHGNRSPRADASLKGMVSGRRLTDSIEELARIYLATIQAVAHGTRHIIDTLNEAGYEIETIVATGGGTKNPLFLREHADVTGCRIVLPEEQEAVILGSAMLGAVAAGRYDSVLRAMSRMSEAGRVVEPSGREVLAYHDRKHAVFQRMYEDQMAYRSLMAGGGMKE
jgi:ribulose kinase